MLTLNFHHFYTDGQTVYTQQIPHVSDFYPFWTRKRTDFPVNLKASFLTQSRCFKSEKWTEAQVSQHQSAINPHVC